MVFLKNGKLAWIIPSVLFISNVVAAHPGALDSHGCHTNHKTGEHHCHRQEPGSTLSSKGGAIGTATVIDGDTIEIRGQRIRLYGIDAPESRQICTLDGKPWLCGKDAAMHLDDLISRRTVRCDAKDTDRYGRMVAVCSVGNTELNARMVEDGFAVAYRKYGGNRYDQEENQARQEKIGVWASDFEMPWVWRKTH
jgi:endonuclease YncB( thermonuclease family)